MRLEPYAMLRVGPRLDGSGDVLYWGVSGGVTRGYELPPSILSTSKYPQHHGLRDNTTGGNHAAR